MKKNRLFICSVIATMGVLPVACTTSHPENVPQLTFENYRPFVLNVASANVAESFKSKNDVADVSGQFVAPPSEAVKKYAANRFKASSIGDGHFTLDIEESSVHFRQIQQDSKVLEWASIGNEDEYAIHLLVRVVAQPSGFKGEQSTTIKMDRTLVMPSSTALVERDMKQTRFLERLVADLDKKVVEAIDQTPSIKQ